MLTLARTTALLLAISSVAIAQRATTAPATQPATARAAGDVVVNRWASEVDAYLKQDAERAPEQNGIVFVGSSSIRGWRTLASDFPGMNVIGRGVGGCQTLDCVRYADVLVLKHRPSTVVFYAGENDLGARPARTPEQVLRHFQTFVDLVHHELPETRILYISMKPSPFRAAILDKMREGNRLIEDYTKTDPRLGYIDVYSAMTDAQGNPRGELFIADRLHMNRAGYELWTSLVRPRLEGAAR